MLLSNVGSAPFYKMHGLGNDFVILDQRRVVFDLSTDQICRMSHRRLGLGCDQVILLRPSGDPTCDASLFMYNADGSSVDMCGNAVRCIGDFLAKETHKTTLFLETPTRLVAVHIRGDDVSRCPVVDIGPPQFLPDSITSIQECIKNLFPQINLQEPPSIISLGNLHAVFFVRDLHALSVEEIGPKFEQNDAFPQGYNLEFVQIDSLTHLQMRVWERGAGVTPACGSGACAAFAAAYRRKRVDSRAIVKMDGGTLALEQTPDGHILMEGPVSYVCSGFLDRSLFHD